MFVHPFDAGLDAAVLAQFDPAVRRRAVVHLNSSASCANCMQVEGVPISRMCPCIPSNG